MPINGMFTLADAVPAMQQGQAWRQAQDQNQRALKQQASMDEANGIVAQGVKDAEADHLKRQRAAWLASGQDETAFKPEPFKPTDKLMFDLSGKRGMALMKAGLVEQAVANEALVQQQRLRVRQGALERFRTDRDHARLATAINDTNPDGREIKKITTIEGVSGLDASPGSPASAPIPQKIRIEFSDGSIVDEEPKKIEAYALALSDPQHASKEAALHLARLTAKAQADERIRVDRVKGEEARKTVGTRTEGTLAAVDRRTEGAVEVAEVRGDAARDVARTRVSGQVSVAQIKEGGAGGSGGGGMNKVQSRFTDDRGNVVLVMRDGTHKQLVSDDGRPVKSIDYQKLIGSTAAAIGKTEYGNTPQQNRDAAKKVLESDSPPSSGAKDYSKLWK